MEVEAKWAKDYFEITIHAVILLFWDIPWIEFEQEYTFLVQWLAFISYNGNCRDVHLFWALYGRCEVPPCGVCRLQHPHCYHRAIWQGGKMIPVLLLTVGQIPRGQGLSQSTSWTSSSSRYFPWSLIFLLLVIVPLTVLLEGQSAWHSDQSLHGSGTPDTKVNLSKGR